MRLRARQPYGESILHPPTPMSVEAAEGMGFFWAGEISFDTFLRGEDEM